MSRMRVQTVLIVSLLASLGLETRAAGNAVEILVSGRFFRSSELVRFIVRVEPHEDNRELRIEIDGEHMFLASTRSLDGAREKRVHSIECAHLPEGSYAVVATVVGANGDRETVRTTLSIH